MSSQNRRAAFFDVDNTLVRGSTIYFLGRGMYQRGFFTKADISRFVLANLRFRLTGTEKQDEINRFQKAAQDFIGGHNVSEINSVAQEIYDEFVSPKLWAGTIEIAQTHLNEGVEVWLVTAAPEDMATLIADRLGFTGALGSKAAIVDGHYTGEMNGPLLHGKEKAIAIRDLANQRGFVLDECFGYSDSHNDFPLLTAVGNPAAINPDTLLQIRAIRDNWPIHDFRRGRAVKAMFGPLLARFAAALTYLSPRRFRSR